MEEAYTQLDKLSSDLKDKSSQVHAPRAQRPQAAPARRGASRACVRSVLAILLGLVTSGLRSPLQVSKVELLKGDVIRLLADSADARRNQVPAHAARCMLRAACCMLRAACCMLRAACAAGTSSVVRPSLGDGGQDSALCRGAGSAEAHALAPRQILASASVDSSVIEETSVPALSLDAAAWRPGDPVPHSLGDLSVTEQVCVPAGF